MALTEARGTNFHLAYQGRDDVVLQQRYGAFLRCGAGARAAGALRAAAAAQARRAHPRRFRRATSSSTAPPGATSRRGSRTWTARASRPSSTTPTSGSPTTRAPSPLPPRPSATCRDGRSTRSRARSPTTTSTCSSIPSSACIPETFTLAALRLAPVQCAGWGHPTTSGHSRDRLVHLLRVDGAARCAERHYSERLALLPGLGTRYAMPRATPGRGRADFGLPDGSHALPHAAVALQDPSRQRRPRGARPRARSARRSGGVRVAPREPHAGVRGAARAGAARRAAWTCTSAPASSRPSSPTANTCA